MKRKLLLVLHVLFWVVFIVMAGYTALHPSQVRYRVRDWWRLRSYQPPAHIERLAQEITLTEDGRDTWYASHPELHTKATFASVCSFKEQTYVIGCYNGDKVYLLDVEEKELESVEQVTAAHELLHAEWVRLGRSQQQDLAAQLRAVYLRSDDQDLRELVDKYKGAGADKNTIDNELHSILATELSTLTPELETYYQRYFTNRRTIVKLFKSYKAIFAQNQAKVDALRAQLTQLKADIDALQSQLSSAKPMIEAGNAQLNTYTAAGDIENYNQLVGIQRQRISQYNQQVRSYNAKINQYNVMLAELRRLSIRHNELVDAIDSRVKLIEGE